MKIHLYTIAAWLLDLFHVRHNLRRRIGGIQGAQTRKVRVALKQLTESDQAHAPTLALSGVLATRKAEQDRPAGAPG